MREHLNCKKKNSLAGLMDENIQFIFHSNLLHKYEWSLFDSHHTMTICTGFQGQNDYFIDDDERDNR